jgi:hypothetical protein
MRRADSLMLEFLGIFRSMNGLVDRDRFWSRLIHDLQPHHAGLFNLGVADRIERAAIGQKNFVPLGTDPAKAFAPPVQLSATADLKRHQSEPIVLFGLEL